jgi:hypothetical protein
MGAGRNRRWIRSMIRARVRYPFGESLLSAARKPDEMSGWEGSQSCERAWREVRSRQADKACRG